VNTGTINVGIPGFGGAMNMMTESLTIGAPAPNLPSTGGTLNIYTNGGVLKAT
jgi:hypothetical protein